MSGPSVTRATAVTVSAAPPTAITLASFTATAVGGGVKVDWSTAIELDTRGYNLLRRGDTEGQRIMVNNALIPAAGQGSGGASYQLFDPSGRTGDLYWLQEIDLRGAISEYGPYTALNPIVREKQRFTVYLPLFRRAERDEEYSPQHSSLNPMSHQEAVKRS